MPNWADAFADPNYVAYATIVKPANARPSKKKVVEVEEVMYDDVLTTVDDPEISGGQTFQQIRIAVGDCVLTYTGAGGRGAGVRPAGAPFIGRVAGIELLPSREWPGLNSKTNGDPAVVLRSMGPADRHWVELQERKGRLPAKYFRLRAGRAAAGAGAGRGAVRNGGAAASRAWPAAAEPRRRLRPC
ncbi:hypothetical protein MNEG_5259 [Monoraphidium neglectum]|uniref:Uncharacterized protein n=1 Tax=Monoraphidium neglectum TaxID=145388 RepID=A0A0D2MI59_9CHLO|nr:hypothetical protein MNEG_5259 [Monoraphidium neglectum]KIZ02705.1 hypothetical protein MNEG_5259 [Monoraphidium neglectum]|eukprot:XP_013901724.1 hypothetical protein MNEG_5259 [Monoraphidium neglectum]